MNDAMMSCADADAMDPMSLRRPSPAGRQWWLGLSLGLSAWIMAATAAQAESVPVPNASFELPETQYVDTRIEAWQKAPKPDWFDESGEFKWDQLTGVFLNQAPTNSAYIDNMTGNQGLYLFAVPQVAVFQDLSVTASTNAAPTNAVNSPFEVGKSYDLTVGVIGGGGNMLSGVSVLLSLYYRDAASNMVTVAGTNITFTPTAFPTTTHFIDQSVHVPTVKSGDAWAGKNIGIQLLSTVTPELSGGYWDFDNMRLSASGGGLVLEPSWAGGQFQFSVQSEIGSKLEVLATTNVISAVQGWTSLTILTNTTGTASFTDTNTNLTSRFYQVRQLP